jgi:hypothetical protein
VLEAFDSRFLLGCGFGKRKIGRWKATFGIVLHEFFEQGRHLLFGLSELWCTTQRFDKTASFVGVASFIERVEAAERFSRESVDEKDVGEVPGSVTHPELIEMSVTTGQFEANALDADSAIGFSQTTRLLGSEGESELVERGTISRDRGALKESFEWALASLGVQLSLVFHLHPGLGRLVQKRQAHLLHRLEHSHETAFDLGEEDLLLTVLMWAIGKRGFMHDTETGEALFDLLGSHR